LGAKIGINTDNPGFSLDVSGDVKVANGITVRISNYDI
jgi:hypothetical protein